MPSWTASNWQHDVPRQPPVGMHEGDFWGETLRNPAAILAYFLLRNHYAQA
jgi:hypothetical protein